MTDNSDPRYDALPPLIRNGAMPLKLSAGGLGDASFKENPNRPLAEYVDQAEWLGEQVVEAFLKSIPLTWMAKVKN